jgi:hypothetical protein
MFSDYQVVSLKNTKPFRDLHTRRCLALRLWEVVAGMYEFRHGSVAANPDIMLP